MATRTVRVSDFLSVYVTSVTLLLLCVILCFPCGESFEIHKHMSPSELREVFHVDSHDAVPEYEVTNIYHRSHVRHRRAVGNSPEPRSSKIVGKETQFEKSGSKLVKNNNYNNIHSNVQNTNSLSRSSEVIPSSNSELENKEEIVYSNENGEPSKERIDEKILTRQELPDEEERLFWDGLSRYENKTDDFDDVLTHLEQILELFVFGKELNLKLKPNEGLIKPTGVKMFSVEPNVTSDHGVDYVEIKQDDHDHIGDIYQDEENEAAILLRKDSQSGEFLVEGSVGKDLVIRPLPSHLRKLHQEMTEKTNEETTTTKPEDLMAENDDDEMFLSADDLASQVSIDTGLPIKRREVSDNDADKSRRKKREARPGMLAPHVVYKRKLDDQEFFSDYALMEPDRLNKRYRRNADFSPIQSSSKEQRRRKRDAPYVIYPEILVIVDYDGYRLHGGDNAQIKRYFVSFWNGVDLRYKLLKGPKIRISIAGIIISRGRDATPYLERNRVGRDAIDSAAALTDMGKYLFKERRLPVYDIAVAITKLDMCRRQFANDVCNRGTAGFAYVGGACVVNKRLEKVNSVAIIEDTGGFSGIIVAAHEVGHLLGAVHDGSPPPSYLGGPGAEKCRWEDGYIMSDLRHTERGFRWSPCSVQSFHHFLNGDTATCLFNAPHEDERLARALPGELLTLDAQCRRDRGTSACFKDERVCAQLFCFDAGSGYCVAYRPAAEGSSCGDGQRCTGGRCVAAHENIVPDFSQHTPPAYARPTAVQEHGYFEEEYTTTTTTAAPPTEYPYDYYQHYTQSTESPYYSSSEQTTPSEQYYQPTTEKTTTRSVFNFNRFSISTTKSPYDFQNYINSKKTTTTQSPYNYNDYTTTTKKPFSFYHFSTKSPQVTRNPYWTVRISASVPTTTQHQYYQPSSTETPQTQTTKNPYVGDYYNRIKITTRNPYNFANFGKTTEAYDYSTTKNPYDFSGGNNYLKRSSNYYAAASQVRLNITKPGSADLLTSTIQPRNIRERKR